MAFTACHKPELFIDQVFENNADLKCCRIQVVRNFKYHVKKTSSERNKHERRQKENLIRKQGTPESCQQQGGVYQNQGQL